MSETQHPSDGQTIPSGVVGTAAAATEAHGVAESRSLFDRQIFGTALVGAFKKFAPQTQIKNPVMFVVLVGTVITFIESIANPSLFDWSITVWLFLTVLFANFAEAMAEGRGKAQADTLRRMRSETEARRLGPDGTEEQVAAAELAKDDLVVCEAGDVVPSDGEIVEGVASVDESAITGESAPVIRESGGDRSAVTGGTKVLSDRIVVRISAEPGHTFLDRMIGLVEGANRQKTPNEVALDILIAGLTLILLVAVVTLQPMAIYDKAIQSTAVLVALFVCLAPTTIGALLSAIGIAGMDRMVQRNVLAMSGRAIEAAGDASTLLLDKTGTITYGNRMASEFIPVAGVSETELAENQYARPETDLTGAELIPFSAQTRMSGGRPGRPTHPQGRGRLGPGLGHRGGRQHPGRPGPGGGAHRPGWRDAASRGGWAPRAGRDPPEGHGQAGHDRAVPAAARHGHPDSDDHRGQPAHRQGHRRRSRRR